MSDTYDEITKNLKTIMGDLGEYTGSTKQEYLEWVDQWRTTYRNLSKAIRELKNRRKPFRYTYRERGDIKSKSRTRIGDNPNYYRGADWHVDRYRNIANGMMRFRELAKESAHQQKGAEAA